MRALAQRSGAPHCVSSRNRRLSTLPPGLRGSGCERVATYWGTLYAAVAEGVAAPGQRLNHRKPPCRSPVHPSLSATNARAQRARERVETGGAYGAAQAAASLGRPAPSRLDSYMALSASATSSSASASSPLDQATPMLNRTVTLPLARRASSP
jgi:hypothetical protein